MASKELTDESIANILESCSRGLEAKVNTKKWRENIQRAEVVADLDYSILFGYFVHQYKSQYGTIEKHSYWIEAAYKISAILSRDASKCIEYGLDPEKGVLLFGGVGVGKTSMMKAFANTLGLLNNTNYPSFLTKNTIDIANEYRDGGALTINRYAMPISEGLLKNGGWFFDDLGNETKANNFGNAANVIEEILQQVYNRRSLKGKVHVSTNLSVEEIKEKYGERVYSRMLEMFNVIVFPSEAKDMRG